MKRLLPLLLCACIEQPDDEALEPALDTEALMLPDLVFFPPVQIIQLPGGGPIVLHPNQTASLGCQTQSFVVSYSYSNQSGAGAGPHANRSTLDGAGSQVASMGPLAAGQTTGGSFQHPLPGGANQPRTLTIAVDDSQAVAETYELNNAFTAKVERRCP